MGEVIARVVVVPSVYFRAKEATAPFYAMTTIRVLQARDADGRCAPGVQPAVPHPAADET